MMNRNDVPATLALARSNDCNDIVLQWRFFVLTPPVSFGNKFFNRHQQPGRLYFAPLRARPRGAASKVYICIDDEFTYEK